MTESEFGSETAVSASPVEAPKAGRVLAYGERGEVRVYADAEELALAAAVLFAEAVAQGHASRGRAFVALSGGSTPRRMGELLAEERFREGIEWSSLEIFWGDERWITEDSDDSNSGVARRVFLDHVPVDPSRVNSYATHISDANLAARMYEMNLKTVFNLPHGAPSFDLIFLGMGDDGHTASLFPGTAAIHETEAFVVAHHVPTLDAMRLTFTPLVLNAAERVIFLVGGAGKADTLARVLEGPDDVNELPSQVVRPGPGRLIWLTDEAAAARLRGPEEASVVEVFGD